MVANQSPARVKRRRLAEVLSPAIRDAKDINCFVLSDEQLSALLELGKAIPGLRLKRTEDDFQSPPQSTPNTVSASELSPLRREGVTTGKTADGLGMKVQTEATLQLAAPQLWGPNNNKNNGGVANKNGGAAAANGRSLLNGTLNGGIHGGATATSGPAAVAAAAGAAAAVTAAAAAAAAAATAADPTAAGAAAAVAAAAATAGGGSLAAAWPKPRTQDAPEADLSITKDAAANSTTGVDELAQGLKQELDIDKMSLEVVEVTTQFEKEAACALHLAKPTFDPERELVKRRVHKGDDPHLRCRTWILRHPLPQMPGDSFRVLSSVAKHVQGKTHALEGNICLAAVTVRINAYQNRPHARWAQILNMSSLRERHGLGTLLIAGMEELLKKEEVDVVVLYPAWNGRAAPFWASLGFCPGDISLLPDEELVPYDKNGPLLPEYEALRNEPLPRWEKHLKNWMGYMGPLSSQTNGHSQAPNSGRVGSNGHHHAPAQPLDLPHRAVPSTESRLNGASVVQATERLLAYRRDLQEEYRRDPRKFPNGLPDVVASRHASGTKRFTPSAKAAAVLAMMRGSRSSRRSGGPPINSPPRSNHTAALPTTFAPTALPQVVNGNGSGVPAMATGVGGGGVGGSVGGIGGGGGGRGKKRKAATELPVV